MATSHAALTGEKVDKVPIKRVLLSVSDKTNLIPLASFLHSLGAELISTGGTFSTLKAASLPVIEIDSFTGFPEILNGRVKTLHPAVHGALLAVRGNEEHEKQVQENGIKKIDLIIVNLYPFQETVTKYASDFARCVENVDIGGPAMIRSGSKNFAYVTVITDVGQYKELEEELKKNEGATTLEFRRKAAAAAFTKTAHYDTAISAYFNHNINASPSPSPL